MCLQHAVLSKSNDDPSTYLINDVEDPLQRSLATLDLSDALMLDPAQLPALKGAQAKGVTLVMLCLSGDQLSRGRARIDFHHCYPAALWSPLKLAVLHSSALIHSADFRDECPLPICKLYQNRWLHRRMRMLDAPDGKKANAW